MLPLALVGLVAVLALLAFMGTTGGATYEGSEKCGVCHEGMLEDWEGTMHGIDFSAWDYNDEPTNKYTYGGGNTTTGMVGSCAECHVVGYDDVANGGFDPSLPWNDTYNAGDTEGENLHLLRIGCENCHGPGSDHTSSKSPDDIRTDIYTFSDTCGNDELGCHGDGRQWGNDTLNGYATSDHYLNEAPSYAQSASCALCRATQGFIDGQVNGEPWEELPEDVDIIWRVTCFACHDPHPAEDEHMSFQLRMEPEDLCVACHRTTSSFGTEEVHHPQKQYREADPVYTAEPSIWMEDVECVECHMYGSGRGTPNEEFKMGHSWVPHMEACMECHSMYETPEDARAAVDHIQHRFHEAIEPAMVRLGAEADDGSLTGIKGLKAWAVGNESAAGDLWTDALELAYSEAHWDLTFAEHDASGSFHNPQLGMDMVAGSLERIEMIEEAMFIGGVSGAVNWIKKEVKGDAIVGTKIFNNAGDLVATTDAEGNYFFWASAIPQTYIVTDDADVLIGKTIIGATAQQNMTKDLTFVKQTGGDDGNGEEEDDEAMTTISWALLGVVIVLVLLLVVMAMKGGSEE